MKQNKPSDGKERPRKFRSSGIEWLGDIPEDWEVKRLKYILVKSMTYGANEAGTEDNPSYPRFIRITDLKDNGELRKDTFRSLAPNLAEPYLLKDKDILFARSGATVGKTFIYYKKWGDACFAGYLIRASINNKNHSEFIYYFTQTKLYWSFISENQIQATIQNVSGEKYGNMPIPLPPVAEQKAIADFLDKETARIDSLIAKQEKLIELLQEKRQALISHAVTKGIPSSNSSLRKMKSSGIEWLGDIPEDWEVVAIKRVSDISYGLGAELDYTLNQGIKIISLPNVDIDGNIDYSNIAYSNISEKEAKNYSLKKGDLLFNWRNGSSNHLGKTAIFELQNNDIYIHVSFLLKIRLVTLKAYCKYYQYFINGLRITGFFISSKAAVNNTFNQSELKELKVLLPPVAEQKAIADFLDKETTKIDNLIEKAKQSIGLSKEKRQALISAAVTGKIDVRGK